MFMVGTCPSRPPSDMFGRPPCKTTFFIPFGLIIVALDTRHKVPECELISHLQYRLVHPIPRYVTSDVV